MEKFVHFCKDIAKGTGNVIVSVVDGACDLARDAWNGVKSLFTSDNDIIMTPSVHIQQTYDVVGDAQVLARALRPIWNYADVNNNGKLDKSEVKRLETIIKVIQKDQKNGMLFYDVPIKAGMTGKQFMEYSIPSLFRYGM